MGTEHDIDQGRLDLVPMIDCVMLLLIFFVLTTKFTSEDQHLSALLPTRGGQLDDRRRVVALPPPTVAIRVAPGGDGEAVVRIGGNEPVLLGAAALRGAGGPELEQVIDDFHRRLAEQLKVYEQPGARTAQLPVEITCATRLPWACAMAVYDAVRGYESALLPPGEVPIAAQRPVSFTAPVIRDCESDSGREERLRLR